MTEWRKALLHEGESMKDAIACLDRSALQIVMVVAPDLRLLGTVTDGDVRRAILEGLVA